MSEHQARKLEGLTLENAGHQVADAFKAKGCIILLQNDDSSVSMTGSGMNHIQANDLLSMGIHLNLSQHEGVLEANARGLRMLRGGRAS